jgi:hypothetical protein
MLFYHGRNLRDKEYIYLLYRLNSRLGNSSSMQVIQEENQPDDEQEDDPTQQGEIQFYFIEKKIFSISSRSISIKERYNSFEFYT